MMKRPDKWSKKWVSFYKQYRGILISDVVHIARPTNLNIDAIMHVNHMLDPCAILIVFNPVDEYLDTVSLDLSFYYTGAEDTIYAKYGEESEWQLLHLTDSYEYTLTFDMEPRDISYWTFSLENPRQLQGSKSITGTANISMSTQVLLSVASL